MSKIKVKYYSAPWCGPCKMYAPVIEKFIEEHPDIEFEKIDVDEAQSTPGLVPHNIRAVPTVHIIKNDVIVSALVGVKSKATLEKSLDEAMI